MARSGSKRRSGSALWLQGLACGALLTFAAPTMLLIGVLMAPVLACFAVDVRPGHGMTRAVALACAASCLRPLWVLWQGDDQLDLALALLSDPRTMGLAWCAGAFAWALCQVVPAVLKASWDLREAARARAIREELRVIEEEWQLERKRKRFFFEKKNQKTFSALLQQYS